MNEYFVSVGSHAHPKDGRCAMEWISYLAGAPHSDRPACVSPVLRGFCIPFNDRLSDEPRQRLRPYLARTIGTRGDGLDEHRGWLCVDWLMRTYAPAWFAMAGLSAAADRLRSLPPVLAADGLNRAIVELQRAKLQRASMPVADPCAPRAVGTRLVANTAWIAGTCIAAPAASRAASAAYAATGTPLGIPWVPNNMPIVGELQHSAFDLLDRMLPTEVIQLPSVQDAHLVCAAE